MNVAYRGEGDVQTAGSDRGQAGVVDVTDTRRRAYEQLSGFYAKHVAYAQIMATRPETMYGLADSPADLAAFMLDHGDGTGQPGLVEQVPQGKLQSSPLTRDDLLDNITLYWLTNTGVSAARLYWENKASFFDAKLITIPFAISVFPDELYQAPRSWAERAYPNNLIHHNKLDKGGHFAAWEQPQLSGWMLDHDTDAYYKISRAFTGGQPSGGLTRDHILDNITLYWLTGTGASAARSYWEAGRAQALAAGQAPPEVKLPVGYTTFPGEIFRAPRSWVENGYPTLTYYHQAAKGGHFAAWEEPQLFSEELRAAFKPLR